MPKPCEFAYTCEFSRQECREPRETPLLVDAMAKALNDMVGFFEHLRQYPADIVPESCPGFDEVMTAAFAAIARHQKEVGDAY